MPGPSRFTVDSSAVYLSSDGTSDDFPGMADRNRNVSQMTTDTHWWSDDSVTLPSKANGRSHKNEKGSGRFFSESFIDELRSRTGSPQSPHRHGFRGEGERVSDAERRPSLATSNTLAHSNRGQEPMAPIPTHASSRDSIDGADIFGSLAAHMEDGRDRRSSRWDDT